MRTVKVFFDGSGGVALAGSVDTPRDGDVRAWAVFAHCFTCNRNYKFIRQVSRVLAQRGIAVLRFDFAGLGESGGNFHDTNFSSNVADIIGAARFLAAQYAPPRLVIGHSLGGTAALAAAAQLPDVRAVATINAPFDPAHVLSQLDGVEGGIERSGHADVTIGGAVYRITPQLVDDLRAARPEEVLGRLQAALLILHAPDDRTAGIAHAERIFAAARQPKSFVALPGADHLLTREDDARYAGEMIATWSMRYTDEPGLRA